MFDLKGGDGLPLFNQLKIGMSCEKCQKMGKAADCTHMASIVPPWKSAAKFVSIYRLQIQLNKLLTFLTGHGKSNIWR